MMLFREEITGWEDWSRVFHSVSSFSSLIEYIVELCHLPSEEPSLLKPGTNAVFRIGDYVIKIYAPKESGRDQSVDLKTELFAITRANSTGVLTPKVVSQGMVRDRYDFHYIIYEFIDAISFDESLEGLSVDEKIWLGSRIRDICDKLNTPSENFNDIDILFDEERQYRWEKYNESFKAERLKYISERVYQPRVFVHGDLCSDNILITKSGRIYVIDFADAVLAPILYEHAHIAVELFDFDRYLLQGFFPNYRASDLVDICFDGLLIHDFGADTIEQRIVATESLFSLDGLKKHISERLVRG